MYPTGDDECRGPTWGEFRINFSNPLGLPLVAAKVGLDLDNSDYAFEHVGHNHVRFELKDQILGVDFVLRDLGLGW